MLIEEAYLYNADDYWTKENNTLFHKYWNTVYENNTNSASANTFYVTISPYDVFNDEWLYQYAHHEAVRVYVRKMANTSYSGDPNVMSTSYTLYESIPVSSREEEESEWKTERLYEIPFEGIDWSYHLLPQLESEIMVDGNDGMISINDEHLLQYDFYEYIENLGLETEQEDGIAYLPRRFTVSAQDENEGYYLNTTSLGSIPGDFSPPLESYEIYIYAPTRSNAWFERWGDWSYSFGFRAYVADGCSATYEDRIEGTLYSKHTYTQPYQLFGDENDTNAWRYEWVEGWSITGTAMAIRDQAWGGWLPRSHYTEEDLDLKNPDVHHFLFVPDSSDYPQKTITLDFHKGRYSMSWEGERITNDEYYNLDPDDPDTWEDEDVFDDEDLSVDPADTIIDEMEEWITNALQSQFQPSDEFYVEYQEQFFHVTEELYSKFPFSFASDLTHGLENINLDVEETELPVVELKIPIPLEGHEEAVNIEQEIPSDLLMVIPFIRMGLLFVFAISMLFYFFKTLYR